MFLSKKKHEVETLVYEYLELVSKCIIYCDRNFSEFLERNTADDEYYEKISKLMKYESRSDDMRKKIEFLTYEKSLIPESRGDIMGLLETVDRVPNQAESLMLDLYRENVSLPVEFKSQFEKLFSVNIRSSKLVIDICRAYFEKPDEINALQEQIDALESESDDLETNLCRELYMSDISGFQKLTLKSFVYSIGHLSDRAENVGDRVKLLSVKTVF